MKISEIITDKYKLQIPPTVYYDLLADVQEAEEKQKPCEDAISRQAVLDLINADWKYEGLEEPINSLPPVNQFKPICCPSMGIDCENCPAYEKKTGHWIDHEKHIECDSCSVWFLKDRLIRKSFCPNCGAKMTESEQKPKSEWEHDHEILKAYSDGANAVLDNVRAEMDGLLNDEDSNMYAHGVMDCLEIIDKFIAEEDKA